MKKADSNKINALRSTGPKDTSRTKSNATKHGLTSVNVGPLDQERYELHRAQFGESISPQNSLDEFLVNRLALYAARLDRCAQLSGEMAAAAMVETVRDQKRVSPFDKTMAYVMNGSGTKMLSDLRGSLLNVVDVFRRLDLGADQPDTQWIQRVDDFEARVRALPKSQGVAGCESVENSLRIMLEVTTRVNADQKSESDRQLLSDALDEFNRAVDGLPRDEGSRTAAIEAIATIERYETSYEKNFFKVLHELERVVRLRGGDDVAAPIAIDVTSHE
jgi:hypothetical protein